MVWTWRGSLKTDLVGCSAVGSVTALFILIRHNVNPTTVALGLLLSVLFIATKYGSRSATLASILAVLSFNYFFLPPFGTLTITDPENWVALVAFLVTALTAGQLSVRARRRAAEAEASRAEVERLYRQLRDAFDRASHAEALRQSEQLKSALLDAVTHDLGTPLTSIKASVTTLLEDEAGSERRLDDTGRRDLLEVINEESDRLTGFIGSLVGIARIEAGALDLRRRWSSVDEIVTIVESRTRPLVRQHRFEKALEPELPALRVDAHAIAEVIYCLVDNAAKYAPPGTCIRLAAGRAAGEMVWMAVEDQGPGIPVEAWPHVFDKFFRGAGGPAGRRRPGGLGMGLAIARGIVEAHGGRIWIGEPEFGTGTRLVFTVPIGDTEPGGEAGDGASGVLAGDQRGGSRG